jgi:hypothetical protein
MREGLFPCPTQADGAQDRGRQSNDLHVEVLDEQDDVGSLVGSSHADVA